MKLGITLTIIGIILIVDGSFRALVGFTLYNITFMVGGFVTGVCLGGYILYRGIKRLRRLRIGNAK